MSYNKKKLRKEEWMDAVNLKKHKDCNHVFGDIYWRHITKIKLCLEIYKQHITKRKLCLEIYQQHITQRKLCLEIYKQHITKDS